MKSINTYYENLQHLQHFLKKHAIEDSASLLIQVFTSKNDTFFIQALLNELASELPRAMIIGSTTDGEIMNAEVSTNKTVLSFTRFEYTHLKTAIVKHKIDGYYSGQRLAESLIGDDTKLLVAFADGLYTNGDAFLEGIHSVNSTVIIAGGLAGDNAEFKKTYVFTKDEIVTKGAVAVSLSGKGLNVSNGYSFNWRRIGKELTITKAVNNRVYTINNKTAVEMYAHYLGEETAAALPEVGIEFPLIYTRNGVKVARAVLGKHDDGSLVFAGNLKTGGKVQFGYGNPSDILGYAGDIFEQIREKPSEAIFIYSCMARRHFMPDTIYKEMEPLQSIAPASGFFTYGEFYTGERKELLNQSMTIVSISESDSVSVPTMRFLPKEEHRRSSMNALINLVNRTSQEAMRQEALEQARSTFEKLFDAASDGIIIFEDNVFIQCNQAMLDLFGFDTTAHFENLSIYQTLPEKQPDGSYSLRKLKKMELLAKKHGSHQFEWAHVRQNGELFWVDIMLTYIELNGKDIMYMVYRDMTDKKKLEEENTFIKERMELALEGSKTSVLDWDFSHNSIYISPSWKEMLGYKDDELPNTTLTWLKRAHSEDVKAILSSLREHEKMQASYFENNHRLKHRDGHWIWVLGRAQIFYDKNGKKMRMIGTHTDITAEKELQLKYSQQAQIIEQVHDGVITTDPKGYITGWNAGAELLFGYTQSEAIGKHTSLLYRQEDMGSLRDTIQASLSKSEVYKEDLVFVNKSKENIPVALSLSLLRDEHGEIIGKVGINQDIAERKQTEMALRRAKEEAIESANSKSAFLANMSHEIRTPMNAILGFIDLLKTEDKREKIEQYIDIIDRSGKGLLKIIEDILDFSKIESGKLEIDKIDFNARSEFEIILQLFLAKSSERNVSLSVNLGENMPESIHTDPLRVKQVIFNLLSNAIKFTGQGKKVIVDIHYKDNYLHVSVKDEGKGIAKDKITHIFESFAQEDSSTTREYGGTGLGLTISYELVKLLGGELKVESEPGVGSEFYFSILAPKGEKTYESKEVLENILFDNKKVLVVEDQPTNQLFIRILLEELHFDVVTVNDGLEAVEAFKQNIYDVILMDESMPNLNGIEATKQILAIEAQNNLTHTPIIALTANAIKGDRERFLAAGMDEYLTKPINKHQLVKVLKMFLVDESENIDT